MNRTARTFATLVALWCLSLPAMAKDNLTILAEDSLMLPLADITRAYARKNGTPITVIRNESEDPARQLEQGFDAHILLSADPTLVQRLAQRGLIDVFGTQSFARTQLALVAPSRMNARLTVAKRISLGAVLFTNPNLPVYASDPKTPSGLRAQALLEGREFSHELASRMVVEGVYETVLNKLQKEDGFALMLAARASSEPKLSIISLLADTISEPVRYDAVVLASDQMEEARTFTRFLTTSEAQAIFAQYGFQPPAPVEQE